MRLFGWIFVGLVVGALARLLLPGRDPIGCLGTIVLGIAGAVIGGWLWVDVFEFGGPGVHWIASVATAMLLLALLRNATYRRGRW